MNYYNHDRDWSAREAQNNPMWGSYSGRVYSDVLVKLQEFKTPPAALLDVGCGAGAFGVRASEAGYEYTGIDESQIAIDLGRKHFKHIKLQQADFASTDGATPFKGCFDIVTALNSLHCLVEKEHRLNFIKNLLISCKKGDGLVLVTTMIGPPSPGYRSSKSPRLLLEPQTIIEEIRQCHGKILDEQIQAASEQAPVPNLTVLFST